MKKISFLLIFILFFSGCAFFSARKADWKACKADAVCFEHAKYWQQAGEVAGAVTGIAIGNPIASLFTQKSVGYLSLLIAMIIGGHALTKKEKPKP